MTHQWYMHLPRHIVMYIVLQEKYIHIYLIIVQLIVLMLDDASQQYFRYYIFVKYNQSKKICLNFSILTIFDKSKKIAKSFND